jgi:uncharacterized protein (TIGR03382 family)
LAAVLAPAYAAAQTGCVFVGGYSGDRGVHVRPGSVLPAAVVNWLLWLFARRRRR